MSLSMRSRQSDTAPGFIKPTVGTQAVQTAIRVQVNGQYVRALIVRALKLPDCLVLLSKPCIDDGDVFAQALFAAERAFRRLYRQYRPALKLIAGADSLQLTARMPRKRIMRLAATMD
jgi:hypothetical protein